VITYQRGSGSLLLAVGVHVLEDHLHSSKEHDVCDPEQEQLEKKLFLELRERLIVIIIRGRENDRRVLE
jgi:hypothetical protein